MAICVHGNQIAPPASNCLYCIAASLAPKISREPLPNGWHLNGKLLAEEERYVLLDEAGHALAEFVSEEAAANVLYFVLRGQCPPAS